MNDGKPFAERVEHEFDAFARLWRRRPLIAVVALCLFTLFVVPQWRSGSKSGDAQRRSPESASVDRTVLSPEQEALLRILYERQTELGARKLGVGREGAVYFDEPERQSHINIVTDRNGSHGEPSLAQEFQVLMESMPPEFGRYIPETRLDCPYVLSVTPAGRGYLRAGG
jgi:hypothetical protein